MKILLTDLINKSNISKGILVKMKSYSPGAKVTFSNFIYFQKFLMKFLILKCRKLKINTSILKTLNCFSALWLRVQISGWILVTQLVQFQCGTRNFVFYTIIKKSFFHVLIYLRSRNQPGVYRAVRGPNGARRNPRGGGHSGDQISREGAARDNAATRSRMRAPRHRNQAEERGAEASGGTGSSCQQQSFHLIAAQQTRVADLQAAAVEGE